MSQHATDQNIRINLLESNGRIYFFQPDIGVIASGDNVESAYEKFLGARRAYWSDLEAVGLSGGRVAPASVAAPAVPRGRGVFAELGLFIVKFAIVLAVIGSVAGFAATRAAERITLAVEQIKMAVAQAAGSVKPISLADLIPKAADIAKDIRSLSPEDKEALRRNIGAISRELDPIVDAWRNPPPGP